MRVHVCICVHLHKVSSLRVVIRLGKKESHIADIFSAKLQKKNNDGFKKSDTYEKIDVSQQPC